MNCSEKSEDGAKAAQEFLKLYKDSNYNVNGIKSHLEEKDGQEMFRQLANNYPNLTEESKVIRLSETCRHWEFGDIHGKPDALEFVFTKLLELYIKDSEAGIEKYLITCTGDILDRGTNHSDLACYIVVISLRLLTHQQGNKQKIAFHLVKGNHEYNWWMVNLTYGKRSTSAEDDKRSTSTEDGKRSTSTEDPIGCNYKSF